MTGGLFLCWDSKRDTRHGETMTLQAASFWITISLGVSMFAVSVLLIIYGFRCLLNFFDVPAPRWLLRVFPFINDM
jgi:hypothetical protein